MINICIIGSSGAWVPGIVTDLMCVFDEQLEIRMHDINPRHTEMCIEWCHAANKHHGRSDCFIACDNREKALAGADAVIITISTGWLPAMKRDLLIPEKYGIFATVGDTCGPGGWSRSIRNIPVFMEFAEDFQNICPKAFIANYTNPMASLTATLEHCCGNPVVGLCHSYFETKDVIQKIFGLENWDDISVSIAGTNHFSWVVDFKIGKEDGYKLLREKIGSGSVREVIPAKSKDDMGYESGHELCIELYDAFGYLPYPADRHTSEFLSFTLSGSGDQPERFQASVDDRPYDIIRYCNIKRTSVEHRHVDFESREPKIKDWVSGKEEMLKKSRETSAEMIRAYLFNKPIVEAVNVLNVGQVPALPLGSCVETIGVVDGMGIRPLMVDNVPEHLLEIMRPQAICQKWITEGAMKRDKHLLLQALYRDPQCAHLKPHKVRAMAGELFEANREFIAF